MTYDKNGEFKDEIPLPCAFPDIQMGGSERIAARRSKEVRDVALPTSECLHPGTSTGAEVRD